MNMSINTDGFLRQPTGAFLVAQMVQNPSANGGDKGSTPGLGISPGEMASHSSILAWEIPRTEEPDVYSPQGPKELGMTE